MDLAPETTTAEIDHGFERSERPEVIPGLGPAIPRFARSSELTQVSCDERMIARLLWRIKEASGLSNEETARRLGITPQALRAYMHGRRTRPSLKWFVRFAEACGAAVTVQFPSR